MKIKNVPKPKRKPPVPKKKNKIVISKDMGEDYTRIPVDEPVKKMGGGYMKKGMMGGGMVGGQKKLDANKDGMITGADFEMMGANRKKNGGKISYKMVGGQVVDSSYD
jgi:hypothetical protein